MTAQHEQDAPQEPASPLTFHDALHHYFAIGNEVYEAKARGDTREMTDAIQGVLDALRASMLETAEKNGVGEQFKSAVADEQRLEKLTLWLRKTANKLKVTKPRLLSLELLGSAGVIVAIAYYVVRVDAWMALVLGLMIIVLRLSLPWVVNRIAVYEECELRELRRIEQHK